MSIQGVNALLQDATSCMQASCRSHFQNADSIFPIMQPACRSYYARMQPAYDGMKDEAGCMRPAGNLHAGLRHL